MFQRRQLEVKKLTCIQSHQIMGLLLLNLMIQNHPSIGNRIKTHDLPFFYEYNLTDYDFIRYIRIIMMLKPLSLMPRSNFESTDILSDQFSPSTRKRADSLVFSITSQKHFSPRDTILLDSRQDDVSRELESLQFKMHSLESKVQYINTDHLISQHGGETQRKIKEQSRFMIDVVDEIDKERNKENISSNNRPGRIIRKDKSLERTSKIVKISKRSNDRSKVVTNESRNSIGSKDFNKSSQLSKLRKAVNTMKQSMQKTQRSKSICSQRLSASKSVIKNLRRQQKKNEKIICKLRSELKKSQNIRDKQKQVILRQQAEIAHYRQLLKLSKPLR